MAARLSNVLNWTASGIAFLIIGTTTAEAMTGNDLYTSCLSPVGRAACIGYVEGVLDTADYEGLFYKGNSNLHGIEGVIVEWCPPFGITSGQAADVATKFLRDNPELRQNRASTLIAQAMKAAWACLPMKPPPGASDGGQKK